MCKSSLICHSIITENKKCVFINLKGVLTVNSNDYFVAVEILKSALSRFFISQLIVCCVGGILWGYFGISYYIETGMFAIIIGFLCGLVSSIYYSKTFSWIYVNGAVLFSFIGIFIGKYIVYAHLYESDLFLSEQSKFIVSLKLIAGFGLSKYSRFVDFFYGNFSFIEFIWFTIAIIAAISTTLNFRRHKRFLNSLSQRFTWIEKWFF